MLAIPFDMPNGIPFIVMEAHVGRGSVPARILLDTGNAAPFEIVVSPAFAARAGAVAGPGPELGTGGAVGDRPVSFRPARLDRVSVGPIRLARAEAGISPLIDAVGRQLNTPLDGIVGLRFVAGRVIAIDYVRRDVDFAARPGSSRAAIGFTLAPRRPLTLVHATINGRGPFLMALDTGASTTLLSPTLAAAVGLDARQVARIGGAGGTAGGGARLGRATIRLGGVTRNGQTIAVADVLGPIRDEAGAPIEGVLGADFFRAGRLVIDYAGHRLWIGNSARQG